MLRNLTLENFRNHSKLSLNIKDLVLIVGPNGSGKSNILESICLLSLCSSYRDDEKKNLVSYSSDFARITGDEFTIFIQKNPRLIFRCQSKGVFLKQSEFIGLLSTVVFSPESIDLVSGSPRNRRRFLDTLISQSDREYLRQLVEYEKVRKQRNSLLQLIKEGRSGEKELSFWDEELIRLGKQIISKRREVIDYLNPEIKQLYCLISGSKEDKLKVVYQYDGDSLAGDLKQSIRRDIATGCTNVGPHREDFSILLNNNDSKYFASRGEKRSIVLALKIAEAHYLEKVKGAKPLLLLDDIFSEFDQQRRHHLIKLISNYQAIITTTEIDEIDQEIQDKSEIIDLGKMTN
ncbi:MAG: DNA replication and repair protein RecF [Candidatus Berkelbacteria bacterium]